MNQSPFIVGTRLTVEDFNLEQIADLKRNRIYFRVFDREWVLAQMPDADADAEVQRQRAAYRRGLRRATAISGILVGVFSGLSAF